MKRFTSSPIAIALALLAAGSVAAPAYAWKGDLKKCTQKVCSWEKPPGCHAHRCPVYKVCKVIHIECADR